MSNGWCLTARGLITLTFKLGTRETSGPCWQKPTEGCHTKGQPFPKCYSIITGILNVTKMLGYISYESHSHAESGHHLLHEFRTPGFLLTASNAPPAIVFDSCFLCRNMHQRPVGPSWSGWPNWKYGSCENPLLFSFKYQAKQRIPTLLQQRYFPSARRGPRNPLLLGCGLGICLSCF